MQLGGTAVLLSGLQRDFCDERGALVAGGGDAAEIQLMLPYAERVLAAARAAGSLVLHVPERTLRDGMSDSSAWRAQYALNGWSNAIAVEGSWGEGAVDGFVPEAGEPVVHRYRPGALYDTRTVVLLRSACISRVVLVGAETHRTILATAIQAACLDYDVVIPQQAVASSQSELGEAALLAMRSWARVVETTELLRELTDATQELVS